MASPDWMEITLISASDLKKVNTIIMPKMNVYAQVTIVGKPELTRITPADKKGGNNPKWNTSFRFAIADLEDDLLMRILLKSKRPVLGGDRCFGEVMMSVRQLRHDCLRSFHAAMERGDGDDSGLELPVLNYQVSTGPGKVKGMVHISCRINYQQTRLTPLPDRGFVISGNASPESISSLPPSPKTASPPIKTRDLPKLLSHSQPEEHYGLESSPAATPQRTPMLPVPNAPQQPQVSTPGPDARPQESLQVPTPDHRQPRVASSSVTARERQRAAPRRTQVGTPLHPQVATSYTYVYGAASPQYGLGTGLICGAMFGVVLMVGFMLLIMTMPIRFHLLLLILKFIMWVNVNFLM